MTSDKQVIANQANALLSTGPNSDEGKAASSQNAKKHNIFSSQKLINGETQEEYDRFEAELMADLQPDGGLEMLWASRVVSAAWRLRRLDAYEAHIVNELTDEEQLT